MSISLLRYHIKAERVRGTEGRTAAAGPQRFLQPDLGGRRLATSTGARFSTSGAE